MSIKKFLLQMFFGKRAKSFEDFVKELDEKSTIKIRSYLGIRGHVLEFTDLYSNKVVFVERLLNENVLNEIHSEIKKREKILYEKGHRVRY